MATAGLLIATMDETINSLQEFIAVNSKGIKWTEYLAISFVSSRDEADAKWFCREWLYAYAYGVSKVVWEVKWGGYCYISHLCRKDTEESCSSKYSGISNSSRGVVWAEHGISVNCTSLLQPYYFHRQVKEIRYLNHVLPMLTLLCITWYLWQSLPGRSRFLVPWSPFWLHGHTNAFTKFCF